MTQTNTFDGFTINLFQDEDGDWLAHLVEMPNVSAFADTPQAAIDELEIAWQGIKESYRKHGEEIPVFKTRSLIHHKHKISLH